MKKIKKSGNRSLYSKSCILGYFAYCNIDWPGAYLPNRGSSTR